MIDKIFSLFFTKTKKDSSLTIIKDREISKKFIQIDRRNKQNYSSKNKQVAEETTCLAQYFTNRKGLNTKERLGYDLACKISNNA